MVQNCNLYMMFAMPTDWQILAGKSPSTESCLGGFQSCGGVLHRTEASSFVPKRVSYVGYLR